MEGNSASLAMSQSIQEKEELDYFLSELEHILKQNEVPLMTRRLENHKEDPMQELVEVYQEVREMEHQMQKSINIGKFIIEKNKDLLNATIELQEENEIICDECNTLSLQVS